MYSIKFIVPYFTCGKGRLHPMTQLWLDSCGYNSTVDFLLVTDCDVSQFDFPRNVEVLKITFESMKKKIQNIFDFEITLNSPYKLCDYKPTYGEVFEEELKKFDYWGFCDIDLIFGNIRKFLNDEILEKYDRILTHGHCSIFRNTVAVNKGYRSLDPKGCMNFRSVYSSDKLWAFDEWALHNGGGYAEIQKRNGIAMYNAPIIADIQIDRFSLHTVCEEIDENQKYAHNRLFHIQKGKVEDFYIVRNNLKTTEYLYVHFQQRKLDFISTIDKKDYLVVPPNKAVSRNNLQLTKDNIKKLTQGNVFCWNVKGQLKRLVYVMYLKIKSSIPFVENLKNIIMR